MNVTSFLMVDDALHTTQAVTSLANTSSLTQQENEVDDEYPAWLKQAWMISLIVTTILLIGSSWATVSFSAYAIAHRKRKQNNKHGGSIMKLTVLVPFLTTVRFFSTQSIIFVGMVASPGGSGDHYCNVVMAISSFFFFAANLPTYVLLWVRQRLLYSRPLLFSINNKVVKLTSCLSLFLMCAGGFGNWVVFMLTIRYRRLSIGCVKDGVDSTTNVAYYQIQCSTLISHLLLFGLFCHPLRLHWKQLKDCQLKSSTRQQSTKKKILGLAKKAIITLAVCSISDLVAMLFVTKVLPSQTPKGFTGVIYDLGLFINILSVVIMENFKDLTVGVCLGSYSTQKRPSYTEDGLSEARSKFVSSKRSAVKSSRNDVLLEQQKEGQEKV